MGKKCNSQTEGLFLNNTYPNRTSLGQAKLCSHFCPLLPAPPTLKSSLCNIVLQFLFFQSLVISILRIVSLPTAYKQNG